MREKCSCLVMAGLVPAIHAFLLGKDVDARHKAGHDSKSCEPGFHRESDGCRPFAGFDLLAAVGLHAGDLEAPIGANHGEAVRLDRDDLAELAGDPLRVLGGQRLGIEYFELLAVERGPGAGRRIAAADQAIDLLPGLAPVDLGVLRTAAAFISGRRLVLLDAWRLAG